MSNAAISHLQSIFTSRLATLDQLLHKASAHFGSDASFLDARIAPDMLPFSTQIVFTCNQARNFALWCVGKPADNLDPTITSVAQAQEAIRSTRELVKAVTADDSLLATTRRVDLGPGYYADLTGSAYVHDFLLPNFYFHFVTAYDILRMLGLDIGKRDYMMHLVPLVRQV